MFKVYKVCCESSIYKKENSKQACMFGLKKAMINNNDLTWLTCVLGGLACHIM